MATGRPALQQAAAIRRASGQARNAMEQLDDEALAELERLYADAAAEIELQVAVAARDGQRVRLGELQGLLASIEATLRALAAARDELVNLALQRAAEQGLRPLTAEGLAATGREVAPVLTAAQAAEIIDGALNFVRTFRAPDGLELSDRLWRLDRGARETVTRAVELAVVQGDGAERAARELLLRGEPVPADVQAAQQAAAPENVARGAAALRDSRAGPLADAQRLMRTEINRAHGEAYMAGSAAAPGVVGFRFLLSPRHPRPDICDLYARQNLHGLGRGVYPTREATPWPAHPNTLSFVVAVFEDEVTEADRAGRETTLEALQRMAPEVREGVLGPTKAGYFDQGLLTRGMLRSTVGATRQRLERRGLLG